MQDTYNTMLEVKEQALKDKNFIRPYIIEYYNVLRFYKPTEGGNADSAMARVVNSLINALNRRDRLPRYLVMAYDMDLFNDVDLYCDETIELIYSAVEWVVRKISMEVRRKTAELLVKKPGAVFTGDPIIIHVRMIRRIDYYGKCTEQDIFALRLKFNDALNEQAAQHEHRIMTINSCNKPEHFDDKGRLSEKGRNAFWFEINDLLERFDKNEVKLLPNPIAPRNNPTTFRRRRGHKHRRH